MFRCAIWEKGAIELLSMPTPGYVKVPADELEIAWGAKPHGQEAVN